MITDADIDKLKAVFATKEDIFSMERSIRADMATKEDLKRFATKDDLKKFATKEDLKRFATKEDLERFATKDDLKGFATKDDLKRFTLKDDLLEMEQRMTKTIVNTVMEVYDYLARQDEEIKPMKREQRGQRVAIGDHESRIKGLEEIVVRI